jgi:hypothetical protein
MAEFERARKEDPNTATPEERFVARFGHDKFSAEIDRDDLAGWPFGQLSREMFYAEIDKALAIRRMSREDNDMHFKKICSFRYQDGAKMTTFAGIFYSDKESECLDACNFSALDFLQPGKEAVFVPTPKLTPREFRHLESQLPLRPGKILDLGHIPQSEAKDFPAIYRYLPTFAVLES